VRRLAATAVFGALALVACSGEGSDTRGWPDVTVEDLATGAAAASSSVLGVSTDRVSVVTVWAVWCQPCRKELPALDELARRRVAEVAVSGINHGDDPPAARAFLDELGVGFPSLRDPDGRLVSALGVVSLPATFVVDVDGDVVWSRLGVVEVAEIDAAVDAALDDV
jgi:cytochrome c biogenesis protein CcmG, thiol:disulfide interchange protein DsbE